ncbi:hypothetical protein HDU93_001908, partial [Gonapodya sp. JEL0774]
TPYLRDWEENRGEEIKSLTAQGIAPHDFESDRRAAEGTLTTDWLVGSARFPMGQTAGAVDEILPVRQILWDIVTGAVERVKEVGGKVAKL